MKSPTKIIWRNSYWLFWSFSLHSKWRGNIIVLVPTASSIIKWFGRLFSLAWKNNKILILVLKDTLWKAVRTNPYSKTKKIFIKLNTVRSNTKIELCKIENVAKLLPHPIMIETETDDRERIDHEHKNSANIRNDARKRCK